MKTLSESLNMKFGVIDGAHIIKNINLGLYAYETLCLICSELNFDTSNITDSDFDSASIILDEFVKNANEETGYTLSVWID